MNEQPELRDEAAETQFREYVQSKPACIQALMRDWPPLAVVKTKPGIHLLVPAPGVEGTIQSYFESGRVGVVAPMTIPHPVHGFGSGEPGMALKAEVDPEQLELVSEPDWTRDDVARALEASSDREGTG